VVAVPDRAVQAVAADKYNLASISILPQYICFLEVLSIEFNLKKIRRVL
jgi:hypothetical protein